MQDQITTQQAAVTLDDLRQAPIWLHWKGVPDEKTGKIKKLPFSPKGNYQAASNKPDTWTDYTTAIKALGQYTDRNGYGIALPDGYNIAAIDIDGHEDGEPTAVGKEVLEAFKARTYTEISPSGTGYHAFCVYDPSQLPFTNAEEYKKRFLQKDSYNEIEIYLSGYTNRYMTFTENCISQTTDLTDCTDILVSVWCNHMRRPLNTKYTEDKIDKARGAANGRKFCALYDRGDLSDYNNDHSSADLALCEMLAFTFNGDAAAIDEAFRNSELYRSKWERPDYRTPTIEKAISLWQATAEDLPQRKSESRSPVKHSDGDRLPITEAAFESFLKEEGITLRTDIINRSTQIKGVSKAYDVDMLPDILPVYLYDKLKERYKGVTVKTMQDYIKLIAGKKVNRFNPVEDILKAAPAWDQTDRLQTVYDILNISPADELSRTMIHKALLQALAITLYNHNDPSMEYDPFPADGVLTLVGAQGMGKTLFVKRLAIRPDLCKEGISIDPENKDSIIKATGGFINELGEVESTLKKDINALKNFITSTSDEYRPPYGATQVKVPRRTTFIATCNSDRYLIDQTGNRRYWTVPIEKIDLQALWELDVLQLWKQIQAELEAAIAAQGIKDGLQIFRLTPDEIKQLEIRNNIHTKPVKAQEEIEDILDDHENNPNQYHMAWVNSTQFKEAYSSLKHFSTRDIGIALEKLGYTQKNKKVNGKPCHVRLLPMPGSNRGYQGTGVDE